LLIYGGNLLSVKYASVIALDLSFSNVPGTDTSGRWGYVGEMYKFSKSSVPSELNSTFGV